MIGDQEQYAVVAAMMASDLGFPARVVLGFAPEVTGDTTIVRGADASAWIEVDTAEFGWVTIDPTPPAREIPEEVPEEPQPLARPQQPVQPPVDEPAVPDDQTPQDAGQDDPPAEDPLLAALLVAGTIAGWLAVAAAIVVSPFLAIVARKIARRRRRRRADTPLARISGGWDEFEDAAIDHGYEPPPSTTRSEFAGVVGGSLPLVLAAVADRAVFSPTAPRHPTPIRCGARCASSTRRSIAASPAGSASKCSGRSGRSGRASRRMMRRHRQGRRMTERCATCGAELPAGAMFCGECGRSVAKPASGASARPATPDDPPEADLIAPPSPAPSSAGLVGRLPAALDPFVPDSSETDPPGPVSPPSGTADDGIEGELEDGSDADAPPEVCELCGTALAHDDIFCPECGHVASGVALAFSRQRDTAAIQPVLPDRPLTASAEEDRDLDAGPSVAARDPFLDLIDPPAPDPSRAERMPGRPVLPVGSRSDGLVPTRPTAWNGAGERFLLQFSTGESVSVGGSGLIGRNPIPEPGESFDQLVRVFDPGRSVSKTHLEFGQQDGVLWLADRYSGNGTVVSELGAVPRRAEAGRRVHVPRGSRVDIGEQFFIVS